METASGFVVVDKPGGLTSHDVVSRMRRLAGTRRVGHAGTLDPMATGVLVIGVGAATRLLTYVVGVDKTYTATIRLGVTTSTDDAEGEVVASVDAQGLTDEQIRAAIEPLTGEIDQVPSSVSAIKVDGKRAYARVRDGEQVELASRRVTIRRFDVLSRADRLESVLAQGDSGSGEAVAGSTGRGGPPGSTPVSVVDLDVVVDVSSGTYVRALARDLGAALGVGGHLTALRRTQVGPFGLGNARTLEQLADGVTLMSPAEAASAVMPVRTVDDAEATALRFGQWLAPTGTGATPTAAIGPDGSLIAVLADERRRGALLARPVLVLAVT